MTAPLDRSGRRATPALVLRIRELSVAIGLVAVAFHQASGRVVGDTKLDLVLNPATFLGRAFSAWDSTAAFGQLQNQAYGYLFPMGPFFLLADAAQAPDWVTERLWWSLLLVIAFTGMMRLTSLLDVGTHPARLVAATAYALSPRVITTLGGISVESWPLALAPWLLVPLVVGARTGSPRRAALLSGLAVAAIGGVNATATVAVLPLPVLFLLTRARGPRRRALLGWWSAGAVLAIAWWVLPLLVLGRYSTPFLDYIETASITTSVTSVTSVLRGTSHWLAYVPSLGEPLWPGGSWLARDTAAVLATTAVAACGLVGLTHCRMPERRFLLLVALLGTVLMAVGHAGSVTSPLSGAVQGLFDGSLAPLRNVHKADPLLRLPLALGLCHLLSVAPAWARERRARMPAARAVRLGLPSSPVVGVVTVVAILVPLAVATAPATRDQLAPAGSFEAVPGYWKQAADWLAARPSGRTLVVPGSSFGEYLWGRPRDEPMQAYAREPWVLRNAVPLGSQGATRLLDALGAELAAGRPSAGLAAALAGAGVGQVLLRHDLDPRVTPDPSDAARASLAGSPGLRRVAGFGPRTGGSAGLVGGLIGPVPEVRVLEVFQVDAGPDTVRATDRTSTVSLVGGSEAVVDLADGMVDAPRATIDSDRKAAAVVVTDTLRRRSLDFGAAVGSGYSPTLTRSADAARGRPAADVLPAGVDGRATTVRYEGATGVSASSTAADPFEPGWRGAATRPYTAFDGDPATAWVSSATRGDQWLELRWRQPRAVGQVAVQAGSGVGVAAPTEVRVRTDAGTVKAAVVGGLAVLDPAEGRTRLLRVVVPRPSRNGSEPVSIAEVSAAGVRVVEHVHVPAPPRGAAPVTWSLRRTPSRGECIQPTEVWVCSPGLARAGEDGSGWRRTLTSPAAHPVQPRVQVRRVPGPELDSRLDAALGYRATASSVYVSDPAARPGAAFDGDRRTAWIAGARDVTPSLSLELDEPVTLTRLRVQAGADTLRRVSALAVEADGARRVVRLGRQGDVSFPALTGRTITVTFLQRADRVDLAFPTPLRVAELSLPDLPDRPASADGVVDVRCDDGPQLHVAGAVTQFAVGTTVAALVADQAVLARPCGDVAVPGGAFEVLTVPAGGLAVDRIVLADETILGPPAPRPVQVDRADAEHLRVRVGTGGAAVLAMTDSANAGWQATVDGRRLKPVTVDGWRQGFLLPAGGDAEVRIGYGPGRWHRAGLALGAGLLAILLALAFSAPRGSRLLAAAPGRGRPGQGLLAGLVVPTLLGGPVGLAAGAVALVVRSRAGDAVQAAVVAGGLMLAGISVALSDRPVGGGTAQTLALVSVALAATALSDRRPPFGLGRVTRDRAARPSEQRALEHRP